MVADFLIYLLDDQAIPFPETVRSTIIQNVRAISRVGSPYKIFLHEQYIKKHVECVYTGSWSSFLFYSIEV